MVVHRITMPDPLWTPPTCRCWRTFFLWIQRRHELYTKKDMNIQSQPGETDESLGESLSGLFVIHSGFLQWSALMHVCWCVTLKWRNSLVVVPYIKIPHEGLIHLFQHIFCLTFNSETLPVSMLINQGLSLRLQDLFMFSESQFLILIWSDWDKPLNTHKPFLNVTSGVLGLALLKVVYVLNWMTRSNCHVWS